MGNGNRYKLHCRRVSHIETEKGNWKINRKLLPMRERYAHFVVTMALPPDATEYQAEQYVALALRNYVHHIEQYEPPEGYEIADGVRITPPRVGQPMSNLNPEHITVLKASVIPRKD